MNSRALGLFTLLSTVLLFVTMVRVDIATAGGVVKGFVVWSPDGTHIAFVPTASIGAYDYKDLYVADGEGNHIRNLTNYADTGVYVESSDSYGHPWNVVWSPDSTSLAFAGYGPEGRLYLANSDGLSCVYLPVSRHIFFAGRWRTGFSSTFFKT